MTSVWDNIAVNDFDGVRYFSAYVVEVDGLVQHRARGSVDTARPMISLIPEFDGPSMRSWRHAPGPVVCENCWLRSAAIVSHRVCPHRPVPHG